MISKRSQLKIQQMAFMLLAVVLFFILVGLLWLSMEFANLHKEATFLSKEKAISTVLKLAETAEISCSEGGEITPDCVDADKLMALKGRKGEYKKLWPVKSIYVYKIYPQQAEEECDLTNYPNCSFFEVYTSGGGEETSVSTFVSLCRKEEHKTYIYDKCELGKILVGFEKK